MKLIEQIHYLIQLLDDPAEEIFVNVRDSIYEIGVAALPELKAALNNSDDELQSQRLKEIIQEISHAKLTNQLSEWRDSSSNDLLTGVGILASFIDPKFNIQPVKNKLDNLAEIAHTYIKEGMSSDEKIEVLNYIILETSTKEKDPDSIGSIANNSLIDHTTDQKMGRPIMICTLFLLVAQRIGLPLVGINSPRHFLTAGLKSDLIPEVETKEYLIENLAFYHDPFNKGLIYDLQEVEEMLKDIGFDFKYKSYLIANPIDIVKRMLNNIIYSFHISGDNQQAIALLKIAENL